MCNKLICNQKEMDKFVNTLTYCLGLTTSEITPNSEHITTSFKTEEIDEEWTLIDVEKSQEDNLSTYPTPPPSPPVEHTWIITPPPCFNAEVKSPIGELSPMENLLIEHPSMFIFSPPDSNNCEVRKEEKASSTPPQHKCAKAHAASRRLRRRKVSRQSEEIVIQQKRRLKSQFKRRSWDVTRRNNMEMRKMRQVIQQPRRLNC